MTHAMERDVFINEERESCRSVFVKLEWQFRISVLVLLLDQKFVPLVCLHQLTFTDRQSGTEFGRHIKLLQAVYHSVSNSLMHTR